MPASPKIIELRKILAERYPHSMGNRSPSSPTGWESLDSLLGSGLPKAAITQLVTPHISSGGTIVLHEIIYAMQDLAQHVALIDSKNCFEPFADHPLLLWVRCHNVLQALKATDLILRDGNFSLVILDLKDNQNRELRKIPATTWYRFARIIEESRNTLFTITPHPIVPNAQITVSTRGRLKIDDLSTRRTDLLKFLSLEVIHSRSLQEYQYA